MNTHKAWFLVVGDLVCLSLFVVAGVLTHEKIFTLVRFVINVVPLAVVWVPAAWGWGALRVAELRSARAMLGRTLTAWLIAAPLALVGRAFITGSKSIVVIFLLVALGLGGAMLLAWRGALWAVWRSERTTGHEPAASA